MPTLRWRILAIITAAAVLAAACGDSDDDGGDVSADTTEAAADTTAAPETTAAETTAAPETTGGTETTGAAAGGGGAGDGELKIGYLLPQTGTLSAIIDALLKPIEMGVEEINAAGGQVTLTGADDGTDPAVGSAAVDGLLADNVDGIIGAAATGVTMAVIDKVTGSEVVQCSGSNTGSGLTTYADNGFYFRTAPPDNLQSLALADVMTEDGATNIAIIYRNDDYGAGFGEELAAAAEANGLTVAASIGYDPDATSFDAEVTQLVDAGVDAIAMITFAEGAALMQGMIEAGVGPADVQVYVADGFKDNVTADQVDPNNVAVLEGVRGTAPSSAPPNGEATFGDRLEAFAPGTPTIFSAHKYDCLMVMVLASQIAGTDDASVWVDEMNGVTQGGTKCSLYEECSALIAEGTDIDYDGASGPLEFIEVGEPGAGVYDVFQYDAAGEPVTESQAEVAT
jgi:branched-chain amino acid transport system substrate-binding protein